MTAGKMAAADTHEWLISAAAVLTVSMCDDKRVAQPNALLQQQQKQQYRIGCDGVRWGKAMDSERNGLQWNGYV